jgi:DNA invertase Pin-like site-specific DNA recombinase
MMRLRKKEISVMVVFAGNKDEFLSAIRQLKPEDCVEIDSFASVAGSAGDMLSAIVSIDGKRADFISIKEKIDTRTEHGRAIFAVCRELYSLDRVRQREKQRNGIEKAKQEGKYKGRKPIFVDESLFEDIVNLWKNGEITARQAMSRLELKPNTFYRRIREWEADQIKKAGRELKTELDALKGKIQ